MQTKKVISINYGIVINSWKPWRWVRLDLIFTIRYVYINSSSLNLLPNSLAAAEALSSKISPPMEHLSDDHKDRPYHHENSHKPSDELGYPFEFHGKSMETETTTWSDFPNGEKGTVEQVLASEEINKYKRAGPSRCTSSFWGDNKMYISGNTLIK